MLFHIVIKTSTWTLDEEVEAETSVHALFWCLEKFKFKKDDINHIEITKL
jgi:hypothetical protein